MRAELGSAPVVPAEHRVPPAGRLAVRALAVIGIALTGWLFGAALASACSAATPSPGGDTAAAGGSQGLVRRLVQEDTRRPVLEAPVLEAPVVRRPVDEAGTAVGRLSPRAGALVRRSAEALPQAASHVVGRLAPRRAAKALLGTDVGDPLTEQTRHIAEAVSPRAGGPATAGAGRDLAAAPSSPVSGPALAPDDRAARSDEHAGRDAGAVHALRRSIDLQQRALCLHQRTAHPCAARHHGHAGSSRSPFAPSGPERSDSNRSGGSSADHGAGALVGLPHRSVLTTPLPSGDVAFFHRDLRDRIKASDLAAVPD
ncbi:hypothetical protein [Actinomadura macrotermitis]|uniref:Uncharacterized protein n=1 Tax=Actinomadura macrotermitis TaxID=2585200 RepID=A0A7K0BRC7_9ACTN|nr:hypothetical protein [Actinomadura macrotermitis]MQY03677.1 hypothetical protein [Actinomadura macrotermitis]